MTIAWQKQGEILLTVLILFCGLPYVVWSSYAGDDKTIYEPTYEPTTISLCIGYDLRCFGTANQRTADCEYVEGLVADQKKITPLEKSLTFNTMPHSEYCGTLIPMTFRNEEKTCRYLLSEKWVCKDNGEIEQ